MAYTPPPADLGAGGGGGGSNPGTGDPALIFGMTALLGVGAAYMKPQIDLKKLRRQRGWTQWQTAAELGFCRSYISSVENGKQGISVEMMNAIIRVFGVKREDFYSKNK